MNLEKTYMMTEKSKNEERGFETFFFDTYAFYEILIENDNYKSYVNSKIVTTKLNIFELYLIVLRNVSEEKAEEILEKYYPFAKDFDENVIKEAAKMKKELNKRD